MGGAGLHNDHLAHLVRPESYADKLAKRLCLHVHDTPGGFARAAGAIGEAGGLLGDIRYVGVIVRHDVDYIVRDVYVWVDSERHFLQVLDAIATCGTAHVVSVSDHILEAHEGGKLAVTSTVELKTAADLLTVYTPGVARVCRLIEDEPAMAAKYTGIWNTVAIVTNGTAVLGLGDIGPVASMPVMEGKGVIFQQMVGISPVPILVDSKDPDEVVDVVSRIAPTFGAIQLEDIAAPACFEIERRLAEQLDRPVFHDDQHGTAIVVAAALLTALKRLGKAMEEVRIAISGAGAAGVAITKMLQSLGAADTVVCDSKGAIYPGRREGMNPVKEELASITNPRGLRGSLADAMRGAEVFIGVSAPDIVTPEMVSDMAPDPIVYALANPTPEIGKHQAAEAGAAFATDGRSLNNALAFPGVFRGALDARARCINDAMKLAAARAIAAQTPEDSLVPDFMDRTMHQAVARAVAEAAVSSGVARDDAK